MRLRSYRVLLQNMFKDAEGSMPSDLSEWDTSSVTDMSVRANGFTYIHPTPRTPSFCDSLCLEYAHRY